MADAARGGDPIAALHAWLDHWRGALERSDFHAGSAVLAVAIEPEEQTGARDGRRRGLRGLGGRVRRHAAGSGVKRKKAARLATLTVAAIEGAVAVSRARGDTVALDQVGRELEAAINAARS